MKGNAYPVLPDPRAVKDDLIRVIDETGKITCLRRNSSPSSIHPSSEEENSRV
jgi:hypothetical protein